LKKKVNKEKGGYFPRDQSNPKLLAENIRSSKIVLEAGSRCGIIIEKM
jgi:hypothetical protein